MVWWLLLAAAVSPALGEVRVAVTNQTAAVLVREGDTVTLTCDINTRSQPQPATNIWVRNICCRWFFCLWDTPGSEGVECALQYHQAETVCHRQSNRTRLIGQEHSCGVQFVVTPAIIDCII